MICVFEFEIVSLIGVVEELLVGCFEILFGGFGLESGVVEV